jgi:FAD binding domain/Berberine and berberine like
MNLSSLANELSKVQTLGPVIGRDHAEYDNSRKIWNSLADRKPAAIVRAHNVDDVRKTVRIAADQGALLAVRCGGHSLPGLSTCDDGIVLDLSLINDVAVDAAAGVVEVGGGALLGDMDAVGARAGLVTPAGVVSHTGVAGLTLGGGMGWLSRRFGLTIDNLLGAEVVTADGRLLWASRDVEPDLFWGLRGGGGNFGVVTKFKFHMHPLDPIFVGCWTYASRDCEIVLHGFQTLSVDAPRELTTSFSFYSAGLVVTACWSGASSGAELAITPFGSLAQPISGSFGNMAYVDLQKRNDETLAWGQRHYSKGGFLGKIDGAAIACMKNAVAHAPTANSDVYVLQLGGAVNDIEDNATPYSGRAASYYWIASAVWNESSEDTRCVAWGRSAAKSLAAISMQGNYVNEQADFGKDVAFNAYGAEKYDRLAKLKARFDPGNLFRLNQNIAPKS